MKDLMLHQRSLGFRLWMTIAPIAMMTHAMTQAVRAEEAKFPMPTTVAPNTTLKVDGDTSMKGINATLKSQFESKFAATKVELAESTSTDALQALRDGKIQVAAIGRPLTEAELADGLVSVPIAFNKIGIFTGKDNPFAQSLTNDQFAKIFRGEITDWKDVGGEAGPIVLVDRPDSSDTRVSFSRYPVFKAAPFAAGSTASKIDKDTNESVVAKLGKTGIGYALAEQVIGRSDLNIVPLHKVLPDNPKYSFSQPLSYVYKGPTPTPEVAAFLGFAQDASNEGAIETARKATASVEGGLAAGSAVQVAVAPLNASASPSVSPSASASPIAPVAVNTPAVDPTSGSGFDWRWLLPLIGIPLIGAWLLGRKPEEDLEGGAGLGGVVPAVAAAAIGTAGLGALGLLGKPKTQFIVTPRDCRDAYAYWDLDSTEAKHMTNSGGRNLALRTYDVTDDDLKRPDRSQYQQTDCDDRSHDHHMKVLRDDRDYVSDLGYVTAKNEWIRLATSDMYHVPSCELEASALIGTRTVAQTDASSDALSGSITVKQVRTQTTDVNLPNLGTVAGTVAGIAAVGGAAALGGTAAAGWVRDRITDETTPETTTPTSYSVDRITSAQVDPKVSHIIMVPKNDREAYVYWELNKAERDRAIADGGQQFVLRVGDAHGQPIDGNTRHSFRQYDLDEQSSDRHVHLPVTQRDYFAEVGYLTRDQRWISLARSTPVHA